MTVEKRASRRAFWGGFVAGAVAMFFLDPTADRSVRGVIGDRASGLLRRTARSAARFARYAWSESVGAEQRLVHRHPGEPADDLALLDRIQSEVYRDPDVPKGTFNIEVVRGVTVLRGQLPDRKAIDDVEHAVRAVDGVREVRNLLHLPGSAAPNKEAVLEIRPA